VCGSVCVCVCGSVDSEDDYTLTFIATDDETYSGVSIWGFIYQHFKEKNGKMDLSVKVNLL
jgi:hypothetical protein